MKLVVLLILLLQAVSCEKMYAMRYMTVGYDYYMGNPLTTGSKVDSGFRLNDIFKFTYDEQRTTLDNRWEIPDRIKTLMDNYCSLQFATTEISGMSKYTELLDLSVGYSQETWHARFKASYDYKQIKEHTLKQHEVYTISEAGCFAYMFIISIINPPEFSDEFIAAVKELPNEYISEKYMNFIKSFGTHYVEEMHMGARISSISRFTQKGWKSLLNKKYTIKLAATGSAYDATGAIDHRYNYDKQMINEFNTARSKVTLLSIGAKPVKGGDTNMWYEATINEPMPMFYTLEAIPRLMKGSYLKVDRDLTEVKSNLERALKEYCGYLVSSKIVSDCNPPLPDPPFPSIS